MSEKKVTKKPAKVFFILERIYIGACGACGFQSERRGTDFQDVFNMITEARAKPFDPEKTPEEMINDIEDVCRKCGVVLERFEEPKGPCVE